MEAAIAEARKRHAHTCRVMPSLWPKWHEWQQAERELKEARAKRDAAKKAWKAFSDG
jgi:hypothetical protein